MTYTDLSAFISERVEETCRRVGVGGKRMRSRPRARRRPRPRESRSFRNQTNITN